MGRASRVVYIRAVRYDLFCCFLYLVLEKIPYSNFVPCLEKTFRTTKIGRRIYLSHIYFFDNKTIKENDGFNDILIHVNSI